MGGVPWSREDVTIVIAGSSPTPAVQSRLIPCAFAKVAAEPPAPAPESQRSLPPLATEAPNPFQSVVAFVGDGAGSSTTRSTAAVWRSAVHATA